MAQKKCESNDNLKQSNLLAKLQNNLCGCIERICASEGGGGGGDEIDFGSCQQLIQLKTLPRPQRFPCFSVNSFCFPCFSVIFV